MYYDKLLQVLKRFSSRLLLHVHNIEADASFVASHGMQIAEAATLAFLPIQFIGAALVSGAIIYAGATINPNYSNPNRSTNQLSR